LTRCVYSAANLSHQEGHDAVKLIVTEKNIAAKKLAEILALGKPKSEKVHGTAVYTFRRDGDDWAAIGLKGHILGVDFPLQLVYDDGVWKAVWDEAHRPTPAKLPASLPTPPWQKRKPFTADGIDLKTWKLASLPFLVWAPIGKSPTEKDIVSALKSLAKKADEVVIATDFDREGELIGSDAAGLVREANKKATIKRARFSAITKEEIERAFDNLTDVDECLAQAGESRQDIDLVWGAVLTRYLTMAKYSGFGNVKPAGRVQTPTLALVVDREREREAFVPETYWTVRAKFRSGRDEFSASHATERFKAEGDAQRVMDRVSSANASSGTVTSVEKKQRKVAPPTPFNTTALQAAAAAEGITPGRAMRIAESLYMDGFISYPRVDNTVYPSSLDLRGLVGMLSEVPAYRDHAQGILRGGALHPTRGAQETTDHPPIHPTGVANPDKMKPEEYKLYNLVARRFLATLSEAAVIEGTKLAIEVAGEPFVAKGDVLARPGFRAIYPYGLKKDEQLPALAEGSEVAFLGADMTEKQTEPPARYSQGRLIQEMEKRGLGTKATRHAIIERLLQVRYLANDPLEPTCLGRAVIDALSQFAPRITTPDMTSELEAEMSDIAGGRVTRAKVVDHSRELLAKVMDDLIPQATQVGAALREAGADDAKIGTCPKSGHDLLVKSSPKTKGQFVGCSGWPECEVTYPLPQGKIEAVEEACPVCGTPQVKVIQFRQKPRVICLDPGCETNKEPEVVVGTCAACAAEGREGQLKVQRSPKTLKRFVRCTNYETCKTSYPLPQNGEIESTGETCAACGAPKVVVKTARGPWKICIDPGCPAKEQSSGKASRGRGRARAGTRASRTRTSSRAGETPGS
jgi:DNA topoisomerase-1